VLVRAFVVVVVVDERTTVELALVLADVGEGVVAATIGTEDDPPAAAASASTRLSYKYRVTTSINVGYGVSIDHYNYILKVSVSE
jgi:hypothetical protein